MRLLRGLVVAADGLVVAWILQTVGLLLLLYFFFFFQPASAVKRLPRLLPHYLSHNVKRRWQRLRGRLPGNCTCVPGQEVLKALGSFSISGYGNHFFTGLLSQLRFAFGGRRGQCRSYAHFEQEADSSETESDG